MTQELLLSRSQLIRSVLVVLLLASALSVLVVFPAELHYDPTGFGRVTGLLHAAPAEVASVPADPSQHYDSPRAYRSDVIEIPLGLGAELEYKVAMTPGQQLVYGWSIVGEGKVYFEFHGESDGTPPRVESYLKGDGVHESFGALRAPFHGIHGWYLLNDSDTPVVIRLELRGFYELSPQFASIGHPAQP